MTPSQYIIAALLIALAASNFFWWGDTKLLQHKIDTATEENGRLVRDNSIISAANNKCKDDVAKANAATESLAKSGAAQQAAATQAIRDVANRANASMAGVISALQNQKPTGDLLTDCKALDANVNAEIARRKGAK